MRGFTIRADPTEPDIKNFPVGKLAWRIDKILFPKNLSLIRFLLRKQIKAIVLLWLRLRNLTTATKVVHQDHDGKVLLNLMRHNAKNIYIVGRAKIRGSVKALQNGEYMAYKPLYLEGISQADLLSKMPQDMSTWWPGAEQSLSYKDALKLYEGLPKYWKTVGDFLTRLLNYCCGVKYK